MPALHDRRFDIEASYSDNDNGFNTLQGVKLDMILDMVNSENITIEYSEGELYLEWVIEGESFHASFIECENY